MDIISYLEFKTNASDFTIPLMVYDGQLSQVCKTLCTRHLYLINVLIKIYWFYNLGFTSYQYHHIATNKN